MTNKLTHLNQKGEAYMVDVGEKDITSRTAIAESFIKMSTQVLNSIESGDNKKGDVFSVARIAGIQAAKKCSELIPLCHPLMLTKINVSITAEPQNNQVRIEALCGLDGKTGVEMEALTAVSIAALTIYDMCKAIDKSMIIHTTQLVNKSGGNSGNWSRGE